MFGPDPPPEFDVSPSTGGAGVEVAVAVAEAVGVSVGTVVPGTNGVFVGLGTVAVGVGVFVGRTLITVKSTHSWQSHLKSVKKIGQVPPPGTLGMVNVNFA